MRIACLLVGPDEYSIAVANALTLEHQVVLIAKDKLIERYRDDLEPDLEVVALDWPRHREFRNIGLIVKIMKILREFQPDVVHFLADTTVWLALVTPLFRRWPLVVTIHDVDYHPGDMQSRTVPMVTIRRMRRAADALVVHGSSLKKLLEQQGYKPKAGIHTIHHIVLNRHRFMAERLGLVPSPKNGTKNVLFFGRALPYKGLPVLLEAMDIVVGQIPQARLVVAGTGPDITRLAEDLAGRAYVELRNRYVPDEEAAQLFLDADIIALPYLEASQSGVITLAAAFALPAVATNTGELGELVREIGMGPVVEPNDPQAFAQSLLEILSDEQRANAYGQAAHQAAHGLLSPATIAHDHSMVYQRALAFRTSHLNGEPHESRSF